ncbi:MAG: DUF1127 domain-containing protein [Pseudomonadota bacterium]
MAVFEHSRPAPFGAETVLKAVEAVEWVMTEIRVRMHANKLRNALSELPSAQLEDIGLSGADLDAYCLDVARRAL